MKSKAGIFCMVLGALLIIGAIALVYWNQKEDAAAKDSVAQIVPQLVQQIQEKYCCIYEIYLTESFVISYKKCQNATTDCSVKPKFFKVGSPYFSYTSGFRMPT